MADPARRGAPVLHRGRTPSHQQLPHSLADRAVDFIAADHPARLIATLSTHNGPLHGFETLRARWTPTEIIVPTLRERTSDIPKLVTSFRSDATKIDLTHDARNALQRHDWPGNISELKATIEPLLDHTHHSITAQDLPDRLRTSAAHPRLTEIEKAERAAITEALHATNGNRVQTATRLGIARATLYRKLRHYGLK